MFVNQVNIKDLFSTNPSLIGRRDQGSDSAFSSSQGNSQFMFSQVDFSESQDFMSGPSQTAVEAKISPGKKFYQRYMSKGLLFPKDSQSKESTKTKLSFKDQLATNKAVAKERDDREIISSIFSVIKESTYELKEAISVVQENLKEGSSSRHELKDHIAKVEENLSKHTVKFLENLTTRDQMKDEIVQLKKLLAEKETELTKIKEQLKETKTSQLKGVKDQLNKMHEEHQLWLSKHLDNVTSQQKQLFNEANAKQQKFTEQQTRTIKKIESTLQKHAESCTKSQKSEQHKYQQWFNDLKESHDQQTSAIRNSLTSNFQDIKQSQKDDVGILIRQQDQLRALYEQHRRDMEKYLEEQLEVTKEGNAEIKELVDHICRETLPSVVGREDRQEAAVAHQSSFEPPERYFNKDSSKTSGDAAKEYPRAQKVDIQFTERTAHPKDGFCSPLTPYVKTWDTKMLFSKRNSEKVDLPQANPVSYNSGSNVSKGTRLQTNHPNLNAYSGKQTRGMKRNQDAFSTSSSSMDNTHDLTRPIRPSAAKRDQGQSNYKTKWAMKASLVAPPCVKDESVTPDARWTQALATKANPGTVHQTRSSNQVEHVDVLEIESQFSSPSLSVSEFFFSTRKEEALSYTTKAIAAKNPKKRKKSRFGPKKKGRRK